MEMEREGEQDDCPLGSKCCSRNYFIKKCNSNTQKARGAKGPPAAPLAMNANANATANANACVDNDMGGWACLPAG